jgi:hypothetical protein
MSVERAATGIPGTTIREVPFISDVLTGAVPAGEFSVARPGALLRVIPGLARFLVRDGLTIDVAIEPGADRAEVQEFLDGAVLGALIHQRGELPLHAATLVPPGAAHAIAFAGTPGTGKSTLACELVRRGWSLLSEDLSRLTQADDRMIAWPGTGLCRLRPDACRRFGVHPESLARAPGGLEKFLLPVAVRPGPAPLSTIVCLQRLPASTSAEARLPPVALAKGGDTVTAVSGARAMALLTEHVYRRRYAIALGLTRSHVRLLGALCSSTRLFQFEMSGSVTRAADSLEAVVAVQIV